MTDRYIGGILLPDGRRGVAEWPRSTHDPLPILVDGAPSGWVLPAPYFGAEPVPA